MQNYLTYILCLSVLQEILDIRDISYRFYLKVISLKQACKYFSSKIVRIPSCSLIPNDTMLKLCFNLFSIRSIMIIFKVDTLSLHLSPCSFHGFILCFSLNSTKIICFFVCHIWLTKPDW